jgi:hypothetical protein
MDNLTTIGALIAAIVALSEAVKIGGRLLMQKYMKPESHQNDGVKNIISALNEQAKIAVQTHDSVLAIKELAKELHRWHSPEISPGVKVWWQRPELIKEIDSLNEQVAALDASVTILGNAVDLIGKDMIVVKNELHDLILRLKYRRRTETSDSFEAIKPKKR